MNLPKNTKGESITETIVALSILAIGITISSTIVSSAAADMRSAKYRNIATNLAAQGIEAVRSIRDTNWLKFSSDRRLCWNHLPGSNGAGGSLTSDTCDGTDPILPGDYVVYKNTEHGWKLDIANGGNEALHEMDMDLDLDTNGDLDPQNDKDIYNHLNVADADSLGTAISQSPFSRTITIEYLENQPNEATAPSNTTPPEDSISTLGEWTAFSDRDALNRWRVTSSVEWQDNSTETVTLQTILTDHLGRTNLSN